MIRVPLSSAGNFKVTTSIHNGSLTRLDLP